MALPSQPVDVLFGGGIDRKTAKHVVAVSKLTRAENRVFRGGLLARRPGYRRLYGPGDEAPLSRVGRDAMLGVHNGNLVARDKDHLLAWSESLGAFTSNGITNGNTGGLYIPPPTLLVDSQRLLGSQRAVYANDVASVRGYQIHTWVSEELTTATQMNPRACVVDDKGAVLIPELRLAVNAGLTGTQAISTASPRVVPMGTSAGIFYGLTGGMRVRFFRSGAPSVIEDAVTIDSTALLHFDAAPMADGRAVVAVIQATDNASTRTVKLYVVNGAGGVDASVTVNTYTNANEPFGTLYNITDLDAVAVGVSTEGNIFVSYAVKNGSAHNSIRAAVYSPALAVVTAEAEVMDLATSLGSTAYRPTLSMGTGSDGTNVYLVMEYWLEVSASAEYKVNCVHAPLTKALSWDASLLEDAALLSRPFALEAADVLFAVSSPASVSTTAFLGGALTSPQGAVLVINRVNYVVARLSAGEERSNPRQGGSGVFLSSEDGRGFAKLDYGVSGNTGLGERAVILSARLTRDMVSEEVAYRLVPFEHHGSLYYPGAIPKQFDGQSLHEVGFSSYIDNFTVASGSGTLPAGGYLCAVIAEWTDATGHLHQSTPIFKAVTLGGTAGITWTVKDVPKTDKLGVTYALYRTYVTAGVASSTLYRLNTTLPSTLTVTESETGIETHAPEYTGGGVVVESVAAPPCGHISEHQRRLVLSGTPSGEVWFSPKYVTGVAPRFSEDFALQPTGQGGRCIATASMDGRLFLLCERNVEYVSGDGPDEAFNGGFADPQVVTLETGCLSPQSVQVTPQGLLFLGERGMFLIGRDGSAGYLGDAVQDLTGNVTGVVHLPTTAEVRILQTGSKPELTYNSTYGEWTSNPDRPSSSSIVWNGKLVWVDTSSTITSIYQEEQSWASDDGSPIIALVETAWLRLNTLAGFQRLRWVHLLATFRGASTITLEVGYDEREAYVETVRCFTGDLNLTPGEPIPIRWKPAYQKCRSVRFRVTCDGGGDAPTSGCDLTGLTLDLAVKQGMFKKSQVETLGQAA